MCINSAAIRFIPYYSISYQEQKSRQVCFTNNNKMYEDLLTPNVMQIDSCLARAIATAQKRLYTPFTFCQMYSALQTDDKLLIIILSKIISQYISTRTSW